jgi:CheY-like chemotaxis protein
VPVGEVADGDEAQRLCQEHNPNVLLDLNMLDPSAFETVVYLREHCLPTGESRDADRL